MSNSHSKTEAPGQAEVPAKVEKARLQAGGKLAAFVPQDLDQAWRLSEALATQAGEMVPEQYRNKPGAVLLAISKGAELGLSPLASLQSIAAINGRATLWGDAIPGLLRREGHRIKEWLEGEGEHMVAYCTVMRGDTGEEITRSFSVDDAKRAKLWSKAGPWQQYPQRMLSMRARSWASRDGAADALLGLHVREEVEDYPRDPERARDVTPREPAENPILATLAEAGGEPDAAPQPRESEATDAEAAPQSEAEDAKPELTPEQEAEIMDKINRQHEEALASGNDNGDEEGGDDEKSPALFP